MRRAMTMAPVLLFCASLVSAGVEVRLTGERVDVKAAAPLAEVLDALAAPLRMKVVYEGPRPRLTVGVSLQGRTPVEAVMGILEGLGINYALTLDASGSRVTTLLIQDAASEKAGEAAGSVSDSRSPAALSRRFRDRAGLQDDAEDSVVGPVESDEPPADVTSPEAEGNPEAPPPDSFAGATAAAPPAISAPSPTAPAAPLVPAPIVFPLPTPTPGPPPSPKP